MSNKSSARRYRVPSNNYELPWGIKEAKQYAQFDTNIKPPEDLDLRIKRPWWSQPRSQGNSSACVGYAVGNGLLRFLLHESGKQQKPPLMSTRFIWQGAKEFDPFTDFPTGFLYDEGTKIQTALHLVYKHGCLLERHLHSGDRWPRLSKGQMMNTAKRYSISGYYNLMRDTTKPERAYLFKQWLDQIGPLVLGIVLDKSWEQADDQIKVLDSFVPVPNAAKHAVTLVGYTAEDGWVLRNSKGKSWGKSGHITVSWKYLEQALEEAFGADIKLRSARQHHVIIKHGQKN